MKSGETHFMDRWLALMLKMSYEHTGILNVHATQRFLNLAVGE